MNTDAGTLSKVNHMGRPIAARKGNYKIRTGLERTEHGLIPHERRDLAETFVIWAVFANRYSAQAGPFGREPIGTDRVTMNKPSGRSKLITESVKFTRQVTELIKRASTAH